MPNKISQFIICLLLVFASGCHDSEKFDRATWIASEEGRDRDLMAENLIKNHTLIGLTHKQLIHLLGEPTNYTDTTKTYYQLSEEFDTIDPVSGKNLVIKFNKDSVITYAEIEEWHKH